MSLDYCADQFALELLPASSITALSLDAEGDFSYLREQAKPHKKVRPSAENVLALQPDTVIRSYGGGPNAEKFYTNLGINVVQLGYSNTISEIETEILRLSKALNNEAKGKEIVADMHARLGRVKPAAGKTLLYVTAGGVTSGTNTLINELLTAAGFNNFEQAPGWHDLPLEELTLRQPEYVATAFYQHDTNHEFFWSSARHPVLKSQLKDAIKISLDDATTTCGGWFLMDALEQLADGAVQ